MIRTRRLPVETTRPRPVGVRASVSVVIPCYNYARFLPSAVGSVLSQTDVDVDVIIVDDASTDESLEVARGLEASDSRVLVLANPTNAGPVDTFNRGLERARGEFVVRLDADDLLTPGSLSRSVALLQAFPSVGIVYGHPIHFEDGPPAARRTVTSWQYWRGHDWLAARCAAGTNVITSPEVVMRRSVVDRVGGQRELAHTHDMEMWLRLAAHSDVGYIVGADQAWHREHAASLSNEADDPAVILGEIRDAFDTLFDAWADESVDPAPLRAAARHGVARQALAYARQDVDRGRLTDRTRQLLALARAVESDVWATREGRRTAVAVRRAEVWPRRLAALVGTLPRFGRRLRLSLARRRWARTGVYERMTVKNPAGPERKGTAQ